MYIATDLDTQVHPFTPIPLCICAEFLNSRDRDIDPSLSTQLQEILNALQYLKNVNTLASENPTTPFWIDLNMNMDNFGVGAGIGAGMGISMDAPVKA